MLLTYDRSQQEERITTIGDEFGYTDDESDFPVEDDNGVKLDMNVPRSGASLEPPSQNSTCDSNTQPDTPQWIDCEDCIASGWVLGDGKKAICSSCSAEQGHADYHPIHWKSNDIPLPKLTTASAKSYVLSNLAHAASNDDWWKRSSNFNSPSIERTLNADEHSPTSVIPNDRSRPSSSSRNHTLQHLGQPDSLMKFNSETSLTDTDDSDICSSDEESGDENSASSQCNISLAKTSLQSLNPVICLGQSSRAAQREICERLMRDVGIFLNSGYMTRGSSQQESPPSSAEASTSSSSTGLPRMQSTPNPRKRPVSNGEHDESEDENWKNTKKPRRKVGTSSNNQSYELACPYRKHDPLKYNVQQWRTCVLTPHKTIARVKVRIQQRFEAKY